jgi:hypothetical protein
MGVMANKADGLFRSLGIDPSRMGPLQKLMLLGGAGAGGAGIATMNPLLMGAGGIAAMAGAAPLLTPGQSQVPLQTSDIPYRPGAAQRFDPTSMDRDEFQHQLQLQGS